MEQNKPWWVSTKEFLPDEGERVLIITKSGAIQDAALRTYLHTGKELFSPDAYKPHEDVKWWMPIPEDGWHDVKKESPEDGAMCLVMGMYGKIYSGKCSVPHFNPYVFDVLFWREMPELPLGVTLNF